MPEPPASLLEGTDRAIDGKAGRFAYAGITHPGRVRRRNEDTFWVDEEKQLFIVADGMGGQRRGAEAARAAAVAVARVMGAEPLKTEALMPEAWRLKAMMRRAFREAHEAVLSAAAGGGTTMDVLLLRGSSALVAHVGDSRAYLLRAGALTQVTRDHTVAGMARKKNVSENEEDHDLLKALGTSDRPVKPDQTVADLRPGDTYLLCSDGLSGPVPDARLLPILKQHWGDPRATTRALAEAALAAGGPDNVTALVVCA